VDLVCLEINRGSSKALSEALKNTYITLLVCEISIILVFGFVYFNLSIVFLLKLSSTKDASSLGKPLKFEFSGRVAKNRFLKVAMTERLSSWDPKDFKARGIPTKNLINVFKYWGEDEFGQILARNIMIDHNQLKLRGTRLFHEMQALKVKDSRHSRSWRRWQKHMGIW
jgi:hypothetical protein